MNTFIKSYSYENIRKKLNILYLLNVADILFTIILLKTNLFEERNSIMKPIVKSPMKSIFIKVVLVFILIKFLSYRMKEATIKQLKISNVLLLGIISLYCLVLFTHILNLALTIGVFLIY